MNSKKSIGKLEKFHYFPVILRFFEKKPEFLWAESAFPRKT